MIENAEPAFCRNCYTPLAGQADQCPACEARNFIAHPELYSLSIAHLDCDAFYAAIEKRDDPDLADKPVIVGGGVRGVVSTCCYVARTYGVHSAMPMFKAKKACPDAVIIKPNMTKYAETGRAIRQMMLDLTPMVEPLSIDEAFMDLTGTDRLHKTPPAITLAKLQDRIEKELGVTVSIGLSHNKFLAKIASDLDKPKGFSIIGKAETREFLARQPVRLIWGIGAAMGAKLQQDGVTTIAQLQTMDPASLGKRYGELGLRLARLSRGEDTRRIKPERETKSVSTETTFNHDITDVSLLEDILWELCETVSARMKASNFDGRVVTLKLKTSNFKTVTRRTTLETPGNLARTTFSAAKRMLHVAAGADAYRLIGIGYSDLTVAGSHRRHELFDNGDERVAAQEKAIDVIREKFGKDAVKAGRTLRPHR